MYSFLSPTTFPEGKIEPQALVVGSELGLLLWASGPNPAPCLINKVLLDIAMTIHVLVVYGCFRSVKAELSHCDRDHMASKA